MRATSVFAIAVAFVALAACGPRIQTGSPASSEAFAVVRSQSDSLGVLSLQSTPNGLRISGTLKFHLPARSVLGPGPHGIHIHQVGRCDPPDYTTAGSHLNPTGAQHGLENPAGPHAGDLPNAFVNEAGEASVDFVTTRTTVSALLDADGSAIVIHQARDDQRTDPAGNAGARVACGVVTK